MSDWGKLWGSIWSQLSTPLLSSLENGEKGSKAKSILLKFVCRQQSRHYVGTFSERNPLIWTLFSSLSIAFFSGWIIYCWKQICALLDCFVLVRSEPLKDSGKESQSRFWQVCSNFWHAWILITYYSLLMSGDNSNSLSVAFRHLHKSDNFYAATPVECQRLVDATGLN